MRYITKAKYYNYYGKILFWKLPIQQQFVNYASDIINNYFKNGKTFMKVLKNRGEEIEEENVKLRDIMLTGQSQKGEAEAGALFCLDTHSIKLSKSTYIIKFSLPKSNLLEHRTAEYFEEQDIFITKWAYENCYLKAIDRILENWGRYMYHLMSGNKSHAGYRYSGEREFVESILKKYNKNKNKKKIQKKYKEMEMENNVKKNDEPSKQRNKTDNNEKCSQSIKIFYVDGSGNLYNNEKQKGNGHYSVYFKDEDKRFKNKEDKITNNQAEIKSVIAAMYYAFKRGFKAIRIYTDSQNTMKWINNRDTKIDNEINEIWNTKNTEISFLIDKIADLSQYFSLIELRYVKKEKNYAHAI